MHIIAEKPSESGGKGARVVLVDRAPSAEISYIQRWVTGIVDERSLRFDEWYWGHYFDNQEDAMRDFLERR